MNRNEKFARNLLPVRFKLRNILFNRYGYANDFIRLDNFLWNTFGEPVIFPVPSTLKPDQIYWKKNPAGVWIRIRNEFMFRSDKEFEIVMNYLPSEYKIVNYII